MSNTTLQHALGGVTAVLVTPFADHTHRINEDLLSRLVARAEEAGIHVITALGNTAEPYQLTGEERRSVLAAVAAAGKSAQLLAGLAGPLDEIVRDGEYVASLGYHGVMVHEPMDPFATSDGLERFYVELADRLPLPVVLYIRSHRLRSDALLRSLQHPNIVAVKYARPDIGALMTLADSLDASGTTWICGAAEAFVPTFSLHGIVGFTSGLANVRPDMAIDIWRASASRDWDALLGRVALVRPFELMRTRDGGRYNVSVVKRALAWQGWDAGDVRAPCVDVDSATEHHLRELLESWPAQATVLA